jgi:PhzF family phenazine biosynthesis protein
MDFYIVEAFTTNAFGGNTAGVVLYDTLDDITMQKIAAELRFSETAFVKFLNKNLFSIRYFTPNSEVALCGHATIASFKVLLHIGLVKPHSTSFLKTINSILPVNIDGELIFMQSDRPAAGKVIKDEETLKKFSSIMGIPANEIGDNKFKLFPEIISTGLFDIMLPVKSRNILSSISPDFSQLAQFTKNLNVVGVHAFTLDCGSFTAQCRNYAPLYGIDEEAATGTSNASLTYYLYKNNIISAGEKEYIFLQGLEMNRPSTIVTKIVKGDDLSILIGGTAYILAGGTIY